MYFLLIQWPSFDNNSWNTGAGGHLEECVHSVWGWWLFFCISMPENQLKVIYLFPDSLVAACVTVLHDGANWSPPVCSWEELRDGPVSAPETWHNLQVCCFSECEPSGCYDIRPSSGFRVSLPNVNELIEMQTMNGTDPRSTATFYERYHSLEDVR